MTTEEYMRYTWAKVIAQAEKFDYSNLDRTYKTQGLNKVPWVLPVVVQERPMMENIPKTDLRARLLYIMGVSEYHRAIQHKSPEELGREYGMRDLNTSEVLAYTAPHATMTASGLKLRYPGTIDRVTTFDEAV